ncbi:MAG: PfkB family carbohydrate kinase [Anaerolineaceae bacterium]
MNSLTKIEPVDYLLIGHVTQDVTPTGFALGGTASYASLTAQSFGKKVGIVTSCTPNLQLPELVGIPVIRKPSLHNSTFENVNKLTGRVQHIRATAEMLTLADIPEVWMNTPIVHLGPIAAEIDPEVAQAFPNSLLGITPQGWLRGWDADGLISFIEWPGAISIIKHANVVVLSIEDVRNNEEVIQEYVSEVPILVVTEGARGARVYWNGDVRHFMPPKEHEIDSVGAGDIFAASFFIRFADTHDPWESARVATQIAARSVTRRTLAGVPTPAEVQSILTEIIL